MDTKDLEKSNSIFNKYSLLTLYLSNQYNIEREKLAPIIFSHFIKYYPQEYSNILDIPNSKSSIKILKPLLKIHNLKQSGNKSELYERLLEHIQKIRNTFFLDNSV
jgi:hypothetical protein